MSSFSDDASSVSSGNSDIENLICDQPIYYVLNQFLCTEDGKNITTIIQELTSDVKKLREAVVASSEKR